MSEKVLVTEEDFGEPEELECHSSEFGVSQKQTPRPSELQKKKRNFTEDGQGQASKLAKTSEHPLKNQMPCASTESGESATDLTRWQCSEGFQATQLEENYAAEEPINCTQSTDSFIPSSQLLKHQESYTGNVTYNCPECKNKFQDSYTLAKHRLSQHNLETSYKCPECNNIFNYSDILTKHRLRKHNLKTPYEGLECNERFAITRTKRQHNLETSYKCPECNNIFNYSHILIKHRLRKHNLKTPYEGLECNERFAITNTKLQHQCMAQHVGKYEKCSDCNYNSRNQQSLRINQLISHNVYDQAGFAIDEALDFPWEVRK